MEAPTGRLAWRRAGSARGSDLGRRSDVEWDGRKNSVGWDQQSGQEHRAFPWEVSRKQARQGPPKQIAPR